MILRVLDLEVFYGARQALFGVSLEVEAGGIVAIMGPNGAGKSTVLKTVAGLLQDQPHRGTIEFDGRRIDGRDAAQIVRRGLGCVPEGRQLFPELTVFENLRMGAYLRRDRRGIAADLKRMQETFPLLRQRAAQPAGTLSGGEQQLLAIARGLMSRPKLLMLDEPSLGLSPAAVGEICAALREINRQGTAVLLVEQNAGPALELARRTFFLHNGRTVEVARREKLPQI